MSEEILNELMLEVHRIECGLPDDLPDYKPSLRHRLAMKRIFARFERNARKLRSAETIQDPPLTEHRIRKYSFKQRILIAALIIVLMTLLAGCVRIVVKFVSERFNGTVYHDYTQLAAVEIENAPKKIEYKCALASVPNGFEVTNTKTSPMCVYTLYTNNQTRQEITLRQWVKSKYTPYYNIENHSFEEITVNSKATLFIDFSNESYCQSMFVWDNEDYIMEIVGDLDKNSVLDLLNITKL